MSSRGDLVYQFVNCRLLRNHQLVEDDLWVRAGKIINPEKLFFEEKVAADEQIDCGGMIISPGFIDVQINGAFGVDFSADVTDIEKGVGKVAKGLLEHGVTSFCPTLVTCSRQTYSEILPGIKKSNGGRSGAGVLGLHLEGPFINKEKKGAHNESFIREFTNGFSDVLEMYGTLDNTVIVTLAPEHERSEEVIKELVHRGIVVSVGHSTSNLIQGETAVGNGASFITHLFNAMLPFHHRDPHLIGLLTSKMIPSDKKVYYGLIADGIHTHPAALRIAHRVDPKGLVLVRRYTRCTQIYYPFCMICNITSGLVLVRRYTRCTQIYYPFCMICNITSGLVLVRRYTRCTQIYYPFCMIYNIISGLVLVRRYTRCTQIYYPFCMICNITSGLVLVRRYTRCTQIYYPFCMICNITSGLVLVTDAIPGVHRYIILFV
ncbi:N-acetylglucosamine-6-phosphate deacetylase-like isoform X1 [Pecten maximus]|uniref:N-acetylglucosamine-6-phosphate deacetylase-like isoform X1 n=1 Tax=Pecten maximus TaxID=6579 RepID=UPI001457ED65|nr:N-acetylglucosamine-6-phosphate deacetylase-like isoform X1 [Pecten maximus]XP_033743994.1 N-acetylglucosamine-6-phosphate deacetylase-like isoform X1 [Pecten maximus]XP_033743995.1 N-acetylglucosamine-6-phosphate deacetylase-like isoform X1 [Pecten maximus]